MSFTSLIDKVKPGSSVVNIPSEWGQGRAAFGGLVAGLVYQSMRQQVPSDVPIRSLQISFIGPVSGEDFNIESEVLRQGKSVAQVQGRGLQGDQTQAVILGSFGQSRTSLIRVQEEPTQFREDPYMIEPMPYLPGVTPVFTQHFDFRFCTAMPFAGSEDRFLRGFVRFKSSEEVDIPQLLGLVDAWPPAVLPMMCKPTPASSLNWNIEFVHPSPRLRANEFCQYRADILFAQDGYACTRAKIWNEAGELLATSQQTVVAFG